MNLVSPNYPAASAYHAPALAPYEFGIATVPLSELLTTPATRAVLQKEAPALLAIANIESIRPYLSNFTIPELAKFFPIGDTAMFAKVDAALRTIPVSERPGNGG